MMNPSPLPGAPKPHIFAGEGNLHFRGSGTICIRLLGRGDLEVHRGPSDSFDFTGRGKPRHFASDHLVLSNGKGLAQVEGEDLDVVLKNAAVHIAVVGHFSVEVRGQGAIDTAGGERLGWGIGGRRLFVDGAELTTAA